MRKQALWQQAAYPSAEAILNGKRPRQLRALHLQCWASEMPSIVIRSYSPAWSSEFSSLRQDIMLALGERARRVAHIGSTAIPGMGAKDIIDIQIGVDELSAGVVSKLAAAGYEFVPKHGSDHVPQGKESPGEDWDKLYFRGPKRLRSCHIHVRVSGSQNHRYALLFRDYLRAHSDARSTVELIKKELARLHGDDADAYYAVKDPVYDLVWQAANLWSLSTGWSEASTTDA